MQMSPMAKAIRNKRAGALDITITIGEPDEEKEQKELGLAPDSESSPNPDTERDLAAEDAADKPGDEAQEKMLIEEELKKLSLGKNSIAGKAMSKK